MAGSVAILARHHQATPITKVRIAGKLSPRTRQELLAKNWAIEEGVSIVPPPAPGARS